jgi:hypothetical protein
VEPLFESTAGELAGHPLTARRVRLAEGLTLAYAWVPGITAEAWDADTVYLVVEYNTDATPVTGDFAGARDAPDGGFQHGG